MPKAFIDEAEEVALEGLKAMKAYLVYQGSNKEYLQKAKVGAAAATAYTRHYASLTNREALKLASERQQQTPLLVRGSQTRKALGNGHA